MPLKNILNGWRQTLIQRALSKTINTACAIFYRLSNVGLSRYLYNQEKIAQPIQVRNSLSTLPVIYEDFLLYQKNYCQIYNPNATRIKRVLCAFNEYCQQNGIDFNALKFEHVDAFRKVFFKNFRAATRHAYRSHLRKFLSYLYHQRCILTKDLSPLVLGRREYRQSVINLDNHPINLKEFANRSDR